MSITPESLYHQAGALVQSMPNMRVGGQVPDEDLIWLSKLAALLEAAHALPDLVQLKTILDTHIIGADRSLTAQKIQIIAYSLLAKAELKAPAAAQGTFIPAGNQFDGLIAVGKILQSATADVMILDPYMDEKALTKFAIQATEGIKLRLLADAAHVKPSLKPAASAWLTQYGGKRPIEVKLASARTLHDRLIMVDSQNAYTLGQSLNSFATRAPTSILKADHETATLKVEAYNSIWQSAHPM